MKNALKISLTFVPVFLFNWLPNSFPNICEPVRNLLRTKTCQLSELVSTVIFKVRVIDILNEPLFKNRCLLSCEIGFLEITRELLLICWFGHYLAGVAIIWNSVVLNVNLLKFWRLATVKLRAAFVQALGNLLLSRFNIYLLVGTCNHTLTKLGYRSRLYVHVLSFAQ